MTHLNVPQIDFKRDPKEWGNALYTFLKQIADALNQDQKTTDGNFEVRISKLESKVNKLNREKI